MSEKSPRRKKQEEKIPESEHNPALERLIDQAPKGSVPEIKQEIQSEQPGKRIISRENDAHLQSQLGKFNTLNFKPGFPPEELFNETPATKETVNDTQLDTLLAKITAEKTLTGAKVLNYLNDLGGESAPPEAIEKIMEIASQRLDKGSFKKLQTIVSEGQTLRMEKSEVIPPVELKQVENEEMSSSVKNVEASPTSTNLSPEVFNTFVHTGEVSDPVLEGIARKIIKKEDLSIEEIAIYREDTEKIEGILRKAESELSKENIVAANPEIQETAPENLPGRSPEELKDFATTFLAGEERENNKLSQEPTAGLPGRDKDGNFNSETIRRAWSSGVSVEVKVKRSSGDVEDGWFVTGSEGQNATVSKAAEGGGFIIKVVPLEELNDLNRIESHPVSVPEASMPTKKESATDSVRAQNIRQRIEELNHEAAGHTSGYVRTGEEIQTEVLALETELKNLERIGKPTEGTPTPEEAPQMTGKGSVFTDAQKERLSKEFGEQSEGTPKEDREKFRSVIEGAKKGLEVKERVWRLGTYLAERGAALGGGLQQLGIDVFHDAKAVGRGVLHPIETMRDAFRSAGAGMERTGAYVKYFTDRDISLEEKGNRLKLDLTTLTENYNKLPIQRKFYITAALIGSSALAAVAALPTLSAIFATGMYATRTLAGAGFALNRRKGMEANIAANPDAKYLGMHITNKSETFKNTFAGVLGAAYMGTSIVAGRYATEKITEWLGQYFGHGATVATEAASPPSGASSAATLEMSPAEEEAMRATSSVEDAPVIPEAPPESPYAGSDAQEHIDKAREAIEKMQKLAEEQKNILNTMPDGSETPPSDLPGSEESVPTPLEQGSPEIEAEPGDTPTHEQSQSESVEEPEGVSQMTQEEAAALTERAAHALKEGHLVTIRDTPLQDQAEEAVSHVNNNHSDVARFQSMGQDGKTVDKLAFWNGQNVEIEINPKSLPAEGLENAPFGHDPIDGHAMSELEAQKLAELRNAMHDPRQTGAWPPGPQEEKGFFEKLFGSPDEKPVEAVGQFSIDSVSAAEPHIYADAEGHLFAHGGSVEDKIETIQKFLTENPDKVIYGTDDSGKYRIPWSLYEGHALPGEPVRTGGFLGFGSSFMDAPKPEEFVKKIK